MLSYTEHRRDDNPVAAALNDLIASAADRSPHGPKEAADHLVATGAIQEIGFETYSRLRDAFPPPKLDFVQGFATGRPREPLTLYWTQGDRYFARKLAWPETFRLYDAAGRPDDLGAP